MPILFLFFNHLVLIFSTSRVQLRLTSSSRKWADLPHVFVLIGQIPGGLLMGGANGSWTHAQLLLLVRNAYFFTYQPSWFEVTWKKRNKKEKHFSLNRLSNLHQNFVFWDYWLLPVTLSGVGHKKPHTQKKCTSLKSVVYDMTRNNEFMLINTKFHLFIRSCIHSFSIPAMIYLNACSNHFFLKSL